MFDFSGKTVLITGASYGLGAGFAEEFARAGADLVLTARSTDLLEATGKTCEALGAKVTTVTGDVSVEADVARVVATAIEHHGAIDVLVNNAGISEIRGFGAEQFPTDVWQGIIDVDLTGAFLYLREVGRHMLERGSGAIVNICSIMSSGASEFNIAAYAAAKGGLRNLTQQLGCEWADRGVRVNSVSPGFIVTEMTRAALEGMGMSEWIASRTPMRRLGELHEITGPVMFLSSELASYITGHDLLVDGGTNASNGYFQIAPIHHEWNKETPMVGARYEGIVGRPDWYQAHENGIPGLHYPLPEGFGEVTS
jgi:NAD(P)-dependent dehydrogenase (short-subunit alcohol dehydrogenase family)